MRALAAGMVIAGLLPAIAAAGRSPADGAIAAAESRVARTPERPDPYVDLATAFMRKSRETADPGYYARVDAALDRALSLEPGHYGALRTRAWVLLGRHDFRGALAAAERAQALDPTDWWNDGTIADAAIELGDYDRAVDAAQRMLDRRPGIPSYTRGAFLRSLLGDRPGAIRLLELAVDAASPADPESFAWTLVHLGHEHFARGDLGAASQAYTRALDVFPGYYLALGALARVRAAEGNTLEAIRLYEGATARVPAPDLVAQLGDLHAAAGDSERAEEQYALVEYMGRVAATNGATYGRQLALFYADHDRHPAEALRLAREEATTRGDVYTDDALAWALHKNGRTAAAARAAHRALRLGTEDAALYYHAGIIAAAAGRPRVATRHLRRALAINPYFDLLGVPVARATLTALVAPDRVAHVGQEIVR